MAISTNPKPTIYLNLYENTAPVLQCWKVYPGSIILPKFDTTHNFLEICAEMLSDEERFNISPF